MNNIRHLSLLLVCMLSVSACGIKDLWLGDDDDDILPGRRLSVLAAQDAADLEPEMATAEVDMVESSGRVSWSQVGGTHNNHLGDLAVAWPLTHDSTVAVGDGNGWDYPYAPQPVVASDMVYAMDAVGAVSAHALDDIDTVEWRYMPTQQDRHLLGGGLTLVGDVLVVAYPTGDVVALEAKTGNVTWSRRLSSPLRAAPKMARGIVLLQTVQSQLVALKVDDGSVVWTHRGIGDDIKAMGRVTPAIYVDQSIALAIVAYASGDVNALTLESGRELWQYEMADAPTTSRATSASSDDYALVGAPSIYRNVAFLASHSGRVVALDIAKGVAFWERKLPPIRASWLAETLWAVYLEDGRLLLLHSKDGRILWNIDVGKNLHGPWLVNNEFWMMDDDGELLRFNRADGSALDEMDLVDGLSAPPVILEKQLLLLDGHADLHSYRGK